MKAKHPDYKDAGNPEAAATAEPVEEVHQPQQQEDKASSKKEAWKSFECFCSFKAETKASAIDHIASAHKGLRHMKFVNESGVCKWVSANGYRRDGNGKSSQEEAASQSNQVWSLVTKSNFIQPLCWVFLDKLSSLETKLENRALFGLGRVRFAGHLGFIVKKSTIKLLY